LEIFYTHGLYGLYCSVERSARYRKEIVSIHVAFTQQQKLEL